MRNPYFLLLGEAWKHAGAEKGKYVAVYIGLLMSNLCTAFLPFIYEWFINRIQSIPAEIIYYTAVYIAWHLGLHLMQWLFYGPAHLAERQLALKIGTNYLGKAYNVLLNRPMAWHNSNHSAVTVNRILKAYTSLRSFFELGFTYVNSIVQLIVSAGAIIYYSPLFGIVAITIGGVGIWATTIFDKSLMKSVAAVDQGEHAISASISEGLSNILTVRAFRLQNRMSTAFTDAVNNMVRPHTRRVRINQWKWFIISILVAIIYSITVTGYVFDNRQGQVFPLGGLVALLLYVTRFTSVFSNIAVQYMQIIDLSVHVQGARSIADESNPYPADMQGLSLPNNWNSMEIANINFQYGDAPDLSHGPEAMADPVAGRNVLNNVALTFRRGERIALIGKSGSGKSTLLSIIKGLHQSDHEIVINVDGAANSIHTIQRQVTLVPQNPELFDNTILYNLTFGLPVETDKLKTALEVAHLNEVINELPEGIKSRVFEKGVNLSGGQKQRVALARGILASSNASIVLLDECTNSVDKETEMLIYQRMFTALAGKTIICSLHNPHLLQYFDCVYALRNGKLYREETPKA